MSKRSSADLPAREGYSKAETRIITDVFGFVQAKDPDGRIQKALEAWLGVDVAVDVVNAMVEEDTVEAEVHIGEAKVYLKLRKAEGAEADWVESYDVSDVAKAADANTLLHVDKVLRAAGVTHDGVRAVAARGDAWDVVFALGDSLWAVTLDGQDKADFVVDDGQARVLASQLIAQTGRTMCEQMGPEAEMEFFAKAPVRKSGALAPVDVEDGVAYAAYAIFADISVVVAFSQEGQVQVRIES